MRYREIRYRLAVVLGFPRRESLDLVGAVLVWQLETVFFGDSRLCHTFLGNLLGQVGDASQQIAFPASVGATDASRRRPLEPPVRCHQSEEETQEYPVLAIDRFRLLNTK